MEIGTRSRSRQRQIAISRFANDNQSREEELFERCIKRELAASEDD